MRSIFINCIFLFLSVFAVGQKASLNFKHLTLENGLSQSSVAPIFADSQGFMWFGTEDGLNRYDGTHFKIYRHQPDDQESLSSSYILSIAEQEDGFLWIGTTNGLNYFNPNKEKFQRFLNISGNPESLGNDIINSLEFSADGNLLVGTGDGLFSYTNEKGFNRITPEVKNKPYHIITTSQDSSGNIWVLTTRSLEKINHSHGKFSKPILQKSLKPSFHGALLLDETHAWIGNNNGLEKYNMETRESENYYFYDSNGSMDTRNQILSIVRANNDGKLWLGSNGGGLKLFDKATCGFQRFVHDPNNRLSLNSNGVRSLFKDKNEILWVGTFSGGINKHDPNKIKFEHYKNEPGNSKSLSGNSVRSILKDSQGELWVGTHKGLNRINPNTGENTIYLHNAYDPSTISQNLTRSSVEDSKGIIWTGTWNKGLNRFDKKTGTFEQFIILPNQIDSINHIPALAVDAADNIWIGSHGLWKFDPNSKQSKNYLFDENNKPKYYIRSLLFDKDSNLWAGTNVSGLIRVDTQSGAVTQFLHDPKNPNSLSHNGVVSIAEDKEGSLWLGTYGGGLNFLNPSNGVFRHYNTSNGLLNDVIYGILIDEQGLIWFTSNAGLCRFDPNTEEFQYFGTEYGIQSDEFNAGAYHKSKNGEFFFGGINGFNAFYPSSINKNKKTGKIVFTAFDILDNKKAIDGKEFLDKSITRVEHIELPYNQNTFSLTFAELNYSDNVDHNYEYQLKGGEEFWRNLGAKQEITIGGLSPGKYELVTRVRDKPIENASIKITISPPFWRTYWAYAAYLLAIIGTGAIFFRQQRKFEKARADFELKITNWENGNSTSLGTEGHANTVYPKLPLKNVSVVSMNQKFLKRAIQIVEENIDDSSFDVEKFKDEMFMSRSQLHRKLKAATGYSTTKFIRLVRLKRAAQLLKGNAGTVAEIAFKVGFENVGYFSKCFNETFGTPPSQYSE